VKDEDPYGNLVLGRIRDAQNGVSSSVTLPCGFWESGQRTATLVPSADGDYASAVVEKCHLLVFDSDISPDGVKDEDPYGNLVLGRIRDAQNGVSSSVTLSGSCGNPSMKIIRGSDAESNHKELLAIQGLDK
jgi:hypothetical protein